METTIWIESIVIVYFIMVIATMRKREKKLFRIAEENLHAHGYVMSAIQGFKRDLRELRKPATQEEIDQWNKNIEEKAINFQEMNDAMEKFKID